MRMHRVAAVVATIGLGLVAVGCGPEPSPTTPMDSAKMKEMYGGSQQPRPGGEPTTAQKGDALSVKVKALEAKTTEELKPLEKATAGLGDKIKAAGGDASKMEPLAKAQKEANVEINDVKE